MSSDFEDTYVKILAAQTRKAAKEKAKTRGRTPKAVIDLGDTTAGKVLAAGSVPDVERTSIHNIPGARSHASRAHKNSGANRGIRKVGMTWR